MQNFLLSFLFFQRKKLLPEKEAIKAQIESPHSLKFMSYFLFLPFKVLSLTIGKENIKYFKF